MNANTLVKAPGKSRQGDSLSTTVVGYNVELEMHDEIFMFESFINFVIHLKHFKTLFEIFIEILYFNYIIIHR